MALTKDDISYFDVARKDGATIAVGGKPHDGPGGGHYVQPTLVTGAHSKCVSRRRKGSGRFLTVIPFRDENDAIEIANGVQYGLPATSGLRKWAARCALRTRWRPA
jgi:5-carboxymethyl-2-hydroxymuconic-semialdehyde dehydrogenase